MPAIDFQLMSDQELSDIVAYIEGLPPVDADVAPVTYAEQMTEMEALWLFLRSVPPVDR